MTDDIEPVELPFPEGMMAQILKVGRTQRSLGHYEAKIAAARMLERKGHLNAAMDVLSLEVDKYLTLEEIARREASPL